MPVMTAMDNEINRTVAAFHRQQDRWCSHPAAVQNRTIPAYLHLQSKCILQYVSLSHHIIVTGHGTCHGVSHERRSHRVLIKKGIAGVDAWMEGKGGGAVLVVPSLATMLYFG